jgi:hypothetical protein
MAQSLSIDYFLHPRWRFALVVTISGLLLSFAGANAAPVFNASAFAEKRNNGVVVGQDQQASGDSAVPVYRFAAQPGSTGGQASADAGVGVLKVSASSSADAAPPMTTGPYAVAIASVRLDDTLVIRSPILSGTGIAQVLALLDRPVPPGLPGGVVTRSGLGDASVGSTVNVGKAGQTGWLVTFGYGAQSTWASAAPWEEFSVNSVPVAPGTGLVTLQVPFTVGDTLKIQMAATAYASAQGNLSGPAAADANLANSLYWGGITSITVGGVTTTNFTALSPTGSDWKRSYIPPPVIPLLPRMEIRPIGADLQISWPATNGVILETTSHLPTSEAWTSLSFTVSGETASATLSPTNNAAFFRLRTVPLAQSLPKPFVNADPSVLDKWKN